MSYLTRRGELGSCAVDVRAVLETWHLSRDESVRLGTPLLRPEPVGELIGGRLPTTIELGLVAVIVGLLIGVPIGIYSAVRQDTIGDYVGRSVAPGPVT